jgi:hypothetical protein
VTNEEAIWKNIDMLKERQGLLAEGLAVVRHEQEAQRLAHAQVVETLARVDAKLDGLASEFRTAHNDLSREIHEARGGLAVGRWIVGTMATVSGAAVALWLWLKTQGG